MRLTLTRPAAPSAGRTVSVVIPCYNYARYLPQAVLSAVSQSITTEVIIIDDCSTDDSTDVAARLAAQHAEVRLVRNETNLGHIATFNKGLRLAEGDFVVLLSADDMLAPGSLARAVGLFERFPRVGMVYGYAPRFEDEPPPGWNTGTSTVWRGHEWLDRLCRRGDNVVLSPEAILRTSLMRELGDYDERTPQASDMLMWMRAAMRADVGRVNAVQAYYRTHPRQMHLTLFAGLSTDMRSRAALYRYYFGNGGEGSHDRRATSRQEHGLASIAREASWRAALSWAEGDDETAGEFAKLALEASPGRRRSAALQLGRAMAQRAGGLVRTLYQAKWNVKSRIWRWNGM
jgi:hypothetical protein